MVKRSTQNVKICTVLATFGLRFYVIDHHEICSESALMKQEIDHWHGLAKPFYWLI